MCDKYCVRKQANGNKGTGANQTSYDSDDMIITQHKSPRVSKNPIRTKINTMDNKYCVISRWDQNNMVLGFQKQKNRDRVLLALVQTEIYYESVELEGYSSGNRY